MTFRQRRKLRSFCRRAQVQRPWLTVRAIDKTGIRVPDALTLLDKESAGGRNIFGSDAGSCRPDFHGRTVTKERYLAYRACRRAGGTANGVGPTQLTFGGFQDRADDLGGCWRPYINMLVGFGIFRTAQVTAGTWAAARAYNGASAYADAFVAVRAHYVTRLRRAGFSAR